MTDGQHGHQVILRRKIEYLIHFLLVFQNLPKPDRAKPEGLGGEQHIFNAGPGSLMVLYLIIHGFRIKIDGDERAGGKNDVAVMGGFAQFCFCFHISDKNKTPWLIVETGRCPDTGPDNLVQVAYGNILLGKFPDAATRINGFQN